MNKQEITQETIMNALQAIIAQGQGQTQQNHPVMDLFKRRLEKQEAEEDEQRRVAIEGQKQNALAMEVRRKQQLAEQEACPHLKPNGMPNVVCQRDHSNNYNYLCQRCFKGWKNNALPGHLAIDPILIGGPQL